MTADTYSNTLGFLIMGVGNDNNTWGGNCSTSVFQIFEDAIANALTNSVTGGTLDLSGSPPPAAASQARYAALIFSGVLGSAQTIQVPNLQKFWFVQNATSGAFTLKFKTPSGSASTAIPQNSGWQVVYCDGANNIVVHPFNTKQIQMPDGSAAAPAYSDVNEPNSGWYRFGAQDWRLSINGVDVVQATGTGASTPSVFNVLSPLSLQSAGTQVIPSGAEMDYAGISLPSGWYFAAGQTVSRATDAGLFGALTLTCTGNTHTNTTLDNLTVDMRNIGLVGAFIEGTGIPSGTTILSIAATSLVLSAAATGTATGIAIRVLPYGQGDGSTNFNLPDRRGTVPFARDDMNGSARGLLTKNTTQGIDGVRLNGTGGEQAHTLTQLESASWTVTGVGTTLVGAPRYTRTDASGGASCLTGGGFTANSIVQVASVDADITNFRVDIAPFANGGGGQTHNNIPPGSICNRLIKR